ncbi:FAD binding domain-containing protein, partial [Pseudomonas syringae pv. tagetis]
IAPHTPGVLSDGVKSCFIPLTVVDLAVLYGRYPQARLLAGGSDLALEVTQFHKPLSVMNYVGHIVEMKGVAGLDARLE